MDKKMKIWLIVAAALVFFGLTLFSVAMVNTNWQLGEKYETNTYNVSEDFDSISIDTDTADILFVLSDDENCKVISFEKEELGHSVYVKEGMLYIGITDDREWYEYIININVDTPKITIHLPRRDYKLLQINESTGDIDISDEFKFERVDIVTSTGDISVENISAGTLDLSVSTGRITVSRVTCTENVSVKVSTGKTYISEVSCKNIVSSGSTGDVLLKNVIVSEKLSIERSTGDVTFEGSDAAEIFVQTDTGDVEGSLLTEKIFVTKTDTGDIDVPQTTGGGKCEIVTDTGDIEITLK